VKVNPWDRQAAESAPAYEAFAVYRDMGVKRSTAEVARKCGKHKSLMDRWSAQHDWVARTRAWDIEQDRLWREEQAEARREIARKHLRVGGAMLAKAVARLQSIDPDKLSAADLERWMRTASMMEQQAIGGLDDEAEQGIKTAAGVITELVRGLREQP
jgi:hypothetical protein